MIDSPAVVAEIRTRADDRSLLDELSQQLVERRLAACVHVRGPERAVYRWEDRIVVDDEHELTAITAPDRAEAVAEAIHDRHPYELASVLRTTVTATTAYASWVEAETR